VGRQRILWSSWKRLGLQHSQPSRIRQWFRPSAPTSIRFEESTILLEGLQRHENAEGGCSTELIESEKPTHLRCYKQHNSTHALIRISFHTLLRSTFDLVVISRRSLPGRVSSNTGPSAARRQLCAVEKRTPDTDMVLMDDEATAEAITIIQFDSLGTRSTPHHFKNSARYSSEYPSRAGRTAGQTKKRSIVFVVRSRAPDFFD
jgi:hypothetical protein